MSLTSYHCSTPRYYIRLFPNRAAKVLLIFEVANFFFKKVHFCALIVYLVF